MFPQLANDTIDVVNENINQGDYNIISDDEKIYSTPNFDFENKVTLLRNGDADLIDDYQNVRNWILLFLLTPIDVYKIYEGTGFGTSLYKVRGYKNVDGMLYAQIQKEIEEGFLLNPNILKVLDVQLYKVDNVLNVYVKVQLQDGYILEESTQEYTLKGY